MYIVTHTRPDLDAITSAWLIQRYLLPDAKVVFVPINTTDQRLLDEAAAVTDMGRAYNPARLRFDHHHFHGRAASQTCATELVYQHLCTSGIACEHLAPLVAIVTDGDGRDPRGIRMQHSREWGIHALWSAIRSTKARTDQDVYDAVTKLLDLIASTAEYRLTISRDLHKHATPLDERVVFIRDGGSASTFAAFEQGYDVVVFHDETNPTTIAVGISVNTDTAPLTTDIVPLITEWADEAGREEIGRWFVHPAGFFAGRGTGKAVDLTPITCNMMAIARLVKRAVDQMSGKEQ